MPQGYGRYGRDKQPWGGIAHRYSYLTFRGPIPLTLTVDHLCHVRCCVNPDHLDVCTRAENARRGNQNINKTHCIHGHALSGKNLYFHKPSGQRKCMACIRDWKRRKRAEQPKKKSGRPKDGRKYGMAVENAAKTHCIRGHPFTPENTYRQWAGGRGCRICRHDYDQKRNLTPVGGKP